MRRILQTMLLVVTAILIAGCDQSENSRVADVALEAAERQAGQNREMARVNQTVADATEGLVAADAEARKEIVTVHREIQAERADLNSQWGDLESERKDIASQRLTESWIGPAIQASGVLLVAGLAIGLCMLLLFGLRKSDPADAELSDLLISELASDQSAILPQSPAPPALDHDLTSEATSAKLPSPDQ